VAHPPSVEGMTSTSASKPMNSLAVANCFLVVDDHDKALAFYRDVLGFTVHTDVTSEGFRWLSVATPRQPDLEITIQSVGLYPGSGEADKEAMTSLLAKGLLGALIFDCEDVDAVFEHVRASGAEILQEPADQFYGVRDCAFRDPAGNMLRFKTNLAS
jgi:catechol 2,3-dioxygenase-like lactoylglutathione lyase family enzyme